METETKIAVFRGKGIRRTIYKNEWWFSVVDICGTITDSPDAGAYWRKLKQRLSAEGSEVVTFCHGLKLIAPDMKMRETDCANTEGIFRIIQSIPSPKVESLKRWLARVGYERIEKNRGLFRKFYFNVIPANAGILNHENKIPVFTGMTAGKGILKLCGNISSIFWPVKKMVFCMLA